MEVAKSLALVTALGIILAIVGSHLARGQSAVDPEQSRFEVASVRPTSDEEIDKRCSTVFKVDGALINIRCMSVSDLVEDAFGMAFNRIVMPASLKGKRYDMAAKRPSGLPDTAIPKMLQALLTERFGLVSHREFRKDLCYVLVVAKDGWKAGQAGASTTAKEMMGNPGAGQILFHANVAVNGVPFHLTRVQTPGTSGFTDFMSSESMGTVEDSWSDDATRRRLEAPGITLDGLAALMTVTAGQSIPIVDHSEIKGRYRIDLDISYLDYRSALDIPYSATPRAPATAPRFDNFITQIQQRDPGRAQDAVLTAFRNALKKYGLRLKEEKAPLEFLIVDHLEAVPTEN